MNIVVLFQGLLSWSVAKEKTLRSTGSQGENKHSDPVFLLQFLDVLYIWLTFVPSLKKIWRDHNSRELP